MISLKVLKEKKVWQPALMVLVLILGGLSSYFYQHRDFFGKDSELAEGSIKLPSYYLLQDGQAKVVAYDVEQKKNTVIYSVPMKQDIWSFSAQISPGGKSVAYTDPAGINIYNLDTKETKQIAKSVIPEKDSGEEMVRSEFAVDPIWAYDGGKLMYRTSVYEGSNRYIVDADGNNKNKIEGVSGSAIWSDESYDYIAGDNNDMGGEYGLYANIDEPIYKTKALLNKPDIYGVDYLAYGAGTTIYFSGVKTGSTLASPQYEIVSFDMSTNKLESLYSTTDPITSLFYDKVDGLIYYGKIASKSNENGSTDGLGIFTFNPADKTTASFYQEDAKQLRIQAINKDSLFLTSKVGTYAPEALVKLISVSKKDKSVIVMGEANKIGFAGWISSNIAEKYSETISTPAPTAKELEDFEISQKTKGALYQTFYDYCWDYDCTLAKYPYSKLSKSKRPEIITLESKPQLLTGDVRIPVVFTQFENAPLQDFQIAALKNDQIAGTFGNLAKWINDQASRSKQKLSFSFEYFDPITLSGGDECIKYEGISKYYNNSCLTAKIDEKYPQLKQEKMIYVAFGKNAEYYNSGGGFGISFDSILGEKTPVRIASTIDTMDVKWDQVTQKSQAVSITEETFNQRLSGNYGMTVDGYSIAKLLAIFGAKDKNATYKAPSNANVDACFVGLGSDVMCRQKLADGKVNYLYKLSELEIGEITKKELGWSDSDGDKTNDVDDKCPFDAKNGC